MIEIIIFIGGLFIGYIVKKSNKALSHMLSEARKSNKICKDKKAELSNENTMLKNPKRLIKEYKGDSGSSTNILLNKMQNEITGLENNISDLTEKKAKLTQDKKDLVSEIRIKEEVLSTELQKIYDKTVIDIDNQLEKARKGNIEDKSKALNNLEKKSEALNNNILSRN